MNTWLPGFLSALIVGVATGLVLGSVAPSHADHELPKPPPLWSPLDEPERLALIEVPNGMADVPAGPFLMGSDPKFDRAAGPQELPQHQVYVDAFTIDRYEVSNGASGLSLQLSNRKDSMRVIPAVYG